MRLRTLIVAMTLLLPGTAVAAGGGSAAVQDCQDGRIDGTYTAAEYRDALKAIPTDVDEYTDCRGVLRSAQLRSASTPSKPSGGAAGAPAARSAPAPVAVPSSDPVPSGGSARAAPSSSEPAGEAGAPEPAAPVGPAPQAPGTAPPPRIPGLPADAAILPGGDPGEGPVLAAPASRVAQQVPPALALLLVVVAAGLLAVRLRVRRAEP